MNDHSLTSTEAALAVLESWQQAGWIRALDLAFATTIAELSREAGETVEPLVLLLAGLCSHQVGRGHSCLDIAQLLGAPSNVLALPPDHAKPADCPTPTQVLAGIRLEDCLSVLSGAFAISSGERPAPLVLAETRLFLWRFWRYEQQIEAGIRARLAMPGELDDLNSTAASSLRQALEVLFADATEAVDYQKIACALAARSAFSVITGGPGTGKTTTVVKLLAALQSLARVSDGRVRQIRLAAPTGKAAARLNESIAGAVGRLPLSDLPGRVELADIPTKVTTLHRLLGSQPNSRRFRYNRDNPLMLDILVIDEASMVDVEMMAAVMDALPASAQLILLGDKDQLASVDAGAVLGQLCRRAQDGHYSPATANWLEVITGQRIPDVLIDPQGWPLDQAVAMLRKSYRFAESSGIRILAEAVNRNQLDAALLRRCRDGEFADVLWLNSNPQEGQALIARHALDGSANAFAAGDAQPVGYRRYLEIIRDHRPGLDAPQEAWDEWARQALTAFNEFQILCALRNGPWGVEGINALVAAELYRAGLISRSEGWYSGRPVLITANDYNLGLMNGDVGITLEVPLPSEHSSDLPETALRVVFPAGDGSDEVRWISPSRLQHLETVYAMTVHKSQGSEFAHCSLVLPDTLSPVLSRELVYTGITRARSWFSLVTSNSRVLQDAVAQRVLRASGLFAED